MSESYWPFDNADTSETQYSQLFRRLQSTGVWGDPTDNTLKLQAGSGLNAILKAGYAFIRGHMYYNDADLIVPVPAGSASQRIDRLVLRLDPAANNITPVIIAGTPGSATPNPLVQTDAAQFDLEIAQITVPASATNIVAGNIADKRTYMGHVYGLWETASRPASPRRGQPGYNHTSGKPEYWNGTAWVGFMESVAYSSLTGVPTSFAPAAHDINGTAHTGTLSIANGGTGVTSKANIDVGKIDGHPVKIQNTDPGAVADGTLWISW